MLKTNLVCKGTHSRQSEARTLFYRLFPFVIHKFEGMSEVQTCCVDMFSVYSVQIFRTGRNGSDRYRRCVKNFRAENSQM